MRGGLLVLSFAIFAAAVAYEFNVRFTRSESTIPPMDENQDTPATQLSISSNAFEQSATIPSKYTCDGNQISPPLSFTDVPETTKSLVLIMEDPDVPRQLKADGLFVHWILFNISPTTGEIAEGTSSGMEGVNGAGTTGYVAPCPPKDFQPTTHRYFFRLYALDTELTVPRDSTKGEIVKAMEGHIIEEAQLMGTYKKQ